MIDDVGVRKKAGSAGITGVTSVWWWLVWLALNVFVLVVGVMNWKFLLAG